MTSADPRRFLYRSLDPDGARMLAARHLGQHDDGELYLQYSASEAFGFDDGRLKTADYHSTSGFGLRGVSGETTAFAHANEISEAAIERAAATLQLLDPSKGAPAPGPLRTNQSMYGADDPLALVPFAQKVALCEKIDAAARARDPRVVQVGVNLLASWSVIDIVRGDGFVASDVRPMVRLGVHIVVKQFNNDMNAKADHGRASDATNPWPRTMSITLQLASVTPTLHDARVASAPQVPPSPAKGTRRDRGRAHHCTLTGWSARPARTFQQGRPLQRRGSALNLFIGVSERGGFSPLQAPAEPESPNSTVIVSGLPATWCKPNVSAGRYPEDKAHHGSCSESILPCGSRLQIGRGTGAE